MTNINIGNKIREFRKKKGITQEALANALNVSPQAVSKWESGLTYPDMTMIPVIAGYFEISLDVLFDYDVKEMKSKIQRIIDDANVYFFDNTERYAETMKSALKEYPGNEALLNELLNAYEYNLRDRDDTSHLDEMIELSQKIISESNDFVRVCGVKDTQAAAYMKKGDYDKAKSVLESLPEAVTLRYDAMSFRLSGIDKLAAAEISRSEHLQSLYSACLKEGDAWLYMDKQKVALRDYTIDEYIPEALRCYKNGLAVLTTFLLTDCYDEPEEWYLWPGMQTFHWLFHQRIAACYKRLGSSQECEKQIDEAYHIISTAWKDFEEKRDCYMEPFYQCLKDYELDEYIR